jgi:hypothetical protein
MEDVENLKATKINQRPINRDHESTESEKVKFTFSTLPQNDQIEDEMQILALWYGDPQLDVLTAKGWIESAQRAKDIFAWTDEVAMTKVLNALYGEALLWFLQLVK